MIYRALNCSVEGWELPPITVWFQVGDAMLAGAATKLRKLLSLAWDVAEEDLCIHDLCSERELEANSRYLRRRGRRSGSNGAIMARSHCLHLLKIWCCSTASIAKHGSRQERMPECGRE